MILTFVQWLRSSLGRLHIFVAVAGSLVLAGQVLHAGPYSATVLATPGLQGYWRLGEASGDFADSGPHGLNGIEQAAGGANAGMSRAVAGPRPADGFLGFEATNTAIHVDRMDGGDWVNIADDDRLDPRTGDWTVEAWFYSEVENNSGFTWAIVGKLQSGGADNNRLGYALLYNYWDQTGSVSGSYRGQAGMTLVETFPGIPVTPDSWHHMVSVLHRNRTVDDTDYQESGVSVFIDGELKQTRSLTTLDGDPGFDINTPHDLVIGAMTQAGNFGFRGLIDEVAVYNRALSPEEVAAHYTAAFVPIPEPNACVLALFSCVMLLARQVRTRCQ